MSEREDSRECVCMLVREKIFVEMTTRIHRRSHIHAVHHTLTVYECAYTNTRVRCIGAILHRSIVLCQVTTVSTTVFFICAWLFTQQTKNKYQSTTYISIGHQTICKIASHEQHQLNRNLRSKFTSSIRIRNFIQNIQLTRAYQQSIGTNRSKIHITEHIRDHTIT